MFFGVFDVAFQSISINTRVIWNEVSISGDTYLICKRNCWLKIVLDLFWYSRRSAVNHRWRYNRICDYFWVRW